MITPPRCSQCGAPIPAEAAFGACPACLVQGAIEVEPDGHGRLERADREAALDKIGPYRLVDKIGEGGFGEVYRAEQKSPVQRRVALKLLKRGMDTRQVVARFEAERQALALMDHPHVATVFEAGESADGRPYFAMELVEGRPITDFCREHGLSIRERLELVISVCEGVQHAHSKGIIHRDLKPSNVLVVMIDGKPIPKVIDFGVAKATDQVLTQKTIFTEIGRFVGTPVYMSPEQAAGSADLDTRSDVYSLGALLYELLTGHTPFDHEELRSAGYGEMERILREEEPPKPSTRLATHGADRKTSHSLRGDLDWIAMRTLEKEPARRYATALGLADELRRYLNDEPVSAGPPSRTYLLRKFARRNKAALGTIAAVALALVVGTIVSIRQAVRATRAEGEAHRQTERAREAEQSAREEAQVSEALTSFLSNEVMGAAFDGGLPSLEKLVAVLHDAESRLESLEDEPLVQAGGYLMMSRLYHWWQLPEKAREYAQRSSSIYRTELGATHEKTLQSTVVYLRILLRVEDYTEAMTILEAMLPAAEAQHGSTHPGVADLLGLREVLLAAQGREEEQVPLLGKLLATQFDESGPWTRLAIACWKLSESSLAEDRREEAIDHMIVANALLLVRNPSGAPLFQNRTIAGVGLRKLFLEENLIPARWSDSVMMFKDLEPKDVLAKAALPSPADEILRTSLLYYREEFAEAADGMRPLVEAHPDRHLLRHAFALHLEKAGRLEEAAEETRTAAVQAARQGNVVRARWYAANWSRLRKVVESPLRARALPRSIPVVDPATGHHYQRIEVPLSWPDAVAACRELGGNLAIVTTAEEDRLLDSSFALDHMCWLGASHHEEDGTWRWINGSPLAYANWGKDQPRSDEDGAHYLAVGRLRTTQILYATRSWNLRGWYEFPGHGLMLIRKNHLNHPIGNVLVVFALCEWESEEAWQVGTGLN